MGNFAAESKPALGQAVEFDIRWLGLGVGALMLAMFLMGGKAEPKRRARAKRRKEKRIQELRKEFRQLTGRWPQLSD